MKKTCRRCGESKPLSEFSSFYCKACNAAKTRKWREANTERNREINRGYYERHREDILKRQREMTPEQREKRNAQARARRAKQPKKRPLYRPVLSPEMKRERARAQSLARYHANREAILEKRKTNRANNAEARAKAARVAKAWRERNPERFKATRERWRRDNWDKVLDSNAKRRARIAEAVEDISRIEIYERDGGTCHICNRHVSKGEFVIDHLIPLSKGGNHTRENVRTAHAKCNSIRSDGRLPAQLLLVG